MPLPPSVGPVVAAAWGRVERAGRGPRPSLQLADIVDAAVAVADGEGLGAVSMARVADSLGFTTMSLYRYVASKDELLMHMQDAALGLPDRSGAEEADWREGLETWALSALEQLLRHSWHVEIPIVSAPMMPCAVAWMDWAMSYLNRLPLTGFERISTLMLLSGYVRNEVSLRVGFERGRQASAVAQGAGHGTGEEPLGEDEAYVAGLRALVDPAIHPSVTAVLEEGLFALPVGVDVDDGDVFMLHFGLHRILDGVAALVASRNRNGRAGTVQ